MQRAKWRRHRKLERLQGARLWVTPARGVVEAMAMSTAANILGGIPLSNGNRLASLDGRSRARMADALEDMQRAYFAYPWLGWATIAAGQNVGSLVSHLSRGAMRVVLATKPGNTPRNRDRLQRIPTDGYATVMTVWLALTEAAGVFRAGDFHVRPVDMTRDDPPAPQLTRLTPPVDLGASFENIDELTYASTYGSLLKVIRVGDVDQAWRRPLRGVYTRVLHTSMRWIVEIPGTDHLTMGTTPNPADPQANMMEVLGLASNQRRAVNRAILDAMASVGITTPEDLAQQEVLLIGHSQGAMVAMALAADPATPYTVRAVASAGGPIGRMPAPEDAAVLALRHAQDAIPLFGGLAGEVDPRVAVFERSLNPPESGVLYYAHAATTYASTARIVAEYARAMPGSNVGRAWAAISDFYPRHQRHLNEPGRVFFYELYQDVLDPKATKEAPHDARQ